MSIHVARLIISRRPLAASRVIISLYQLHRRAFMYFDERSSIAGITPMTAYSIAATACFSRFLSALGFVRWLMMMHRREMMMRRARCDAHTSGGRCSRFRRTEEYYLIYHYSASGFRYRRTADVRPMISQIQPSCASAITRTSDKASISRYFR